MRDSAGAEFDFLSDPDGEMLDFFGVRHPGGAIEGGDIAQSASFLLDRTGRLLWSRVAENYRVRPRPAEILAAADEGFGG
jgi:peroxiredoxin